ncbi:hypothetical protein TRFO_29408 [Tritrichomonas foetus]|uniref:DUF3447 domain-containing protein n=1 Tax=Tritrichomonas foetus TaxID=1144522 RepID=A0A1J4JX70_9EUKA|nr:hypothetical protein TRFO_29408 [Tritrichomonas foetus]|eukprot:OHT03266.1 hypothetical protein TRFO_29408 [Tritrichomonas foetus]
MVLIGEAQFRKEIIILRDLQRMMISILKCESNFSIKKEINELFAFLDKISLSQNFDIYEGFLRIFVHLSVYFNTPQQKEETSTIFFIILKELISKHSLKASFHQSTLFLIFKANKHFLLFIFNEGILDFSFIEKEISIISNKLFSYFFIPELAKLSPKIYGKLKEQFNLTDKIIQDLYDESNELNQHTHFNESNESKLELESKLEIENKYDIRRKIHSQENIALIIRSDDINNFIEFISRVENFDLNSKIQPSFFENNPDINNEEKGISLLEYSMAFGSINIFRYLWLKKVDYSSKSLKYYIIGNNYEILRILEEESKFSFDEGCYCKCIEYYHPEMTKCIQHLQDKKHFAIFDIFHQFNQTTNIEILYEIILNEEQSEISNTENLYFSNTEDWLASLMETFNIEITKILEKSNFYFPSLPFYFVYSFLLQQSNLNSKNKIFIFLFKISIHF